MITTQLSILAHIQTGPFGSQLHKEDYAKDGTPIVTVEHLGERLFTRQNLPSVSEHDKQRLAKYQMLPGDIIFSRVGSVDRCSQAQAQNDGWLFSGRCLRVRPNKEIDSNYLYYWLSSKAVKKRIQSIAVGATMPSINTSLLGEIEVPLQSQEDQAAVGLILASIDKLIELNQQLNDYLAEIGKTIWTKTADRATSTMKIVDVVADVITGKTPPTKKTEYYGQDYPFVTIPDMHSVVWLCSTERSLSEAGNKSQPKKLVPRGSVLVSCIATVGLVGMAQKPSHFNQQINAVLPARGGEEFYLYYAMHSIKQDLLGIGATGSATLNVNKGAFSSIEIPWPSEKEMEMYIRTVKPLFEAIEVNTTESLRLQELRDILLPKLMFGEIDVSKVEL